MENANVATEVIVKSEQPEVKRPRRTGLIIGGVAALVALVALVALAAGAAFVGGQLLSPQANPQGVQSVGAAGGGAARSEFAFEYESAKELPATPPDVSGLFSERKDNSVFVKVGDGTFMATVDENGMVQTEPVGNGQKLEVVVTNETLVYQDVTEMLAGNPPADGTLQQKVAPGALDEIGQNSFVTAWGERRGDRLMAKVLLYSPPMIMAAPMQIAP